MRQVKWIFITLMMIGYGHHALAQELTVHQGFWKMKYYEDSQEISKQQFEKKINTVPSASAHYDKYKSNVTIGSVLVGIGAGLTTAVIINNSNDPNKNKTGLLIGGLAGYVGGSVFFFTAQKNMRNATLTYNSSVTHTLFKLGPSSRGLGIALTF